jgi:hypothetical protein
MAARTSWTPPAGMKAEVSRAWREFYRQALERYNVTPRQYRDLYVAQYGCCYICRKAKGKHPDDPRGTGGRRLGIDHNHVTDAVRGLLCTGGDKTCNRIIGWLTPEALERAVVYVREEPAQHVLAKSEDLDRAGIYDRSGRDEIMRKVLELS